MITIPNERKLPQSIIFLNLSSLFTNYCLSNTEVAYALRYTNKNNVISIINRDNKVLDIQVTEDNIQITPLALSDHLYEISGKFIKSLLN
jgi:hypothetical protein